VRVTISVLTFSCWTATPLLAIMNDSWGGYSERRKFGRRGIQEVFQLKSFVLASLPRVGADMLPGALI
jgi:hypothetical protein